MARKRNGIIQKEKALKQLGEGRAGAIQVRTEARINSDEYRAAGDVTKAIDVLTDRLTGDPMYFHAKPHG